MAMEVEVEVEQTDGQDRLSDLNDDILLSILGRLDTITAASTSVLSKRWRHLPLLLPEINLDAKDFFCTPCPNSKKEQHMDQAMASLTKATRTFLANPHNRCTVTRLSIKLYLIGNHWRDIGPLVNNAIDAGLVTELDLAIIDENKVVGCNDDYMRRQGKGVNGLLGDCDGMHRCLKTLYLTNVRFYGPYMDRLLFNCCKHLEHLTFYNCDAGVSCPWFMHAPNSNLKVLEIYQSRLGRLRLFCLPKLERFLWDTWFYHDVPLVILSIPSLEEFSLSSAAAIDQEMFHLSERLSNTPNIHTLTLNFQGKKLWIKPEEKQLSTTFTKLRKLNLHGINVEFDLLWTAILLEAAPSVEILSIEILENPRNRNHPRKPFWRIPEFTNSTRWHLKELEMFGFRPLKHQMLFLRVMLKRVPGLRKILLKEFKEAPEDRKSMDVCPPLAGDMFPRNKDKQEKIVSELRCRVHSSAKIIFGC